MNSNKYKEHIINKNYFKTKLNQIDHIENKVNHKKQSYINELIVLYNSHLLRLSQYLNEINNELYKLDTKYLYKVFSNSKLFFISEDDAKLFEKISRFELESSIQVRSHVFDYENLENFILFRVVFYFNNNDFIYNSCIMLVFNLKFDSISNEFLIFQEDDGFGQGSNHNSYKDDYDLYLKWKSPISSVLYKKINGDFIRKQSFFDIFDIVNGKKSQCKMSLIYEIYKNIKYVIDNLGVLYIMNNN